MINPEIKPRSYQLDCLEAITQAIESGASRALIVMASGLGKTLTSAFAVERFLLNAILARSLCCVILRRF